MSTIAISMEQWANDKVSASQPWDHGFEPHMGHDHVSSYDTSTCWFQEADSRVINISC